MRACIPARISFRTSIHALSSTYGLWRSIPVPWGSPWSPWMVCQTLGPPQIAAAPPSGASGRRAVGRPPLPLLPYQRSFQLPPHPHPHHHHTRQLVWKFGCGIQWSVAPRGRRRLRHRHGRYACAIEGPAKKLNKAHIFTIVALVLFIAWVFL